MTRKPRAKAQPEVVEAPEVAPEVTPEATPEVTPAGNEAPVSARTAAELSYGAELLKRRAEAIQPSQED